MALLYAAFQSKTKKGPEIHENMNIQEKAWGLTSPQPEL